MTTWILFITAASAYGYRTMAVIDKIPSYEECVRVSRVIPELVRPEFKCIEVRMK